MAVRMAALGRSKNVEWFARKGIPADVLEAYARFHGVRWEAQLKLLADTSRHEAKALHGEWLSEIETRIATLRAVAKGEGQPLSKLNAIALAGRWYQWFVRQHESEPGAPERWRKLSDYFIWKVLHPEASETFHENPQADPEWKWAKEPHVRRRVRPHVAQIRRWLVGGVCFSP